MSVGEYKTEQSGAAATSKRTPRTVSAFTVIELLATTLIAAVLMLAVLTVVGQLGRDQNRLARRETAGNPEWIVDLLRKDMARATRITVDLQTGSVVLEGYGALSPTTFTATGRAARVTYELQTGDNNVVWLMRRQTPLDEPYATSWVECVSSGIRRLTVTPELTAALNSTMSNGPMNSSGGRNVAADTPLLGPDGLPLLADRVRLKVQWIDANRAPLEQVVVLR